MLLGYCISWALAKQSLILLSSEEAASSWILPADGRAGFRAKWPDDLMFVADGGARDFAAGSDVV